MNIISLALVILVCCFASADVSFQIDDEKLIDEISKFDVCLGLPTRIVQSRMADYLQLVDSQKEGIQSLKQDAKTAADRIKNDDSIELRRKIEKLRSLRKKLQVDVRGVLLPHQIELELNFAIYSILRKEGLANSIVNGAIAQRLDLSVPERKELKQSAEKILEEYKKDLRNAQKKAIASLAKSVPAEKRKKYVDMIKPMLRSDGTLADDFGNLLDMSKKRGGVTYLRRLPPLTDDN